METATHCVGSAEYEVVVDIHGRHHHKAYLFGGRPEERRHVKCRKQRENWQVDMRVKRRVLDTTVTVVDKNGYSTLSHCRNKLSAGTQSVDRSDVTAHL